jgi:hypothetical protein
MPTQFWVFVTLVGLVAFCVLCSTISDVVRARHGIPPEPAEPDPEDADEQL